MINAIKDIGASIKEIESLDKNDVLKNLVKPINTKDITKSLIIDIKDSGEIEVTEETFSKSIVLDALYFQAGNGMKGGGIRGDFFPLEDDKKFTKSRDKFIKKVNLICTYCEVQEQNEKVQEIILNKMETSGRETFFVLKKNGKFPIELFKDKFMGDFYKKDFNRLQGKHNCHLCNKKDTVCHSTTTFKFYTNDKSVYSSLDHKDKWGIAICEECLDNIILGKKFIEEYMETYWLGSNVMFIPHNFNEEIQDIFESVKFENGFLKSIRESEKDVFEELGKIDSEIDIVFFDRDDKTFYIHQTIKSLVASRFSFLAKELEKYSNDKYKFTLWGTLKDICILKIGKTGKFESIRSEELRYLEAIFKGNKLNRNQFFNRAMKKYKEKYYSKEGSKFYIKTIGQNYNFLVDCRCLKGGFNCMKDYKNKEELFSENTEYFNSNEKKAWFIVGSAWNYIDYKMKESNRGDDGKVADRSSLDKNFFFSKKFDFKDFIRFTNLLSEKTYKYRISNKYIKELLIEAKELMADREGKLNADEAKYLFFWGKDMYFKKDEMVKDGSKESVDNE